MSCCDDRFGNRPYGQGCGGMRFGNFDRDDFGGHRFDFDRDDFRHRRFDFDRDDFRRRGFDFDRDDFGRRRFFAHDRDDMFFDY